MKKLEIVGLVCLAGIFSYAAGYGRSEELNKEVFKKLVVERDDLLSLALKGDKESLKKELQKRGMYHIFIGES